MPSPRQHPARFAALRSAAPLVTAVMLFAGCGEKAPQSGVLMGKFREVGEFSLTDQGARTVDQNSLKGRVWIANFIFTSCNAECLILSGRFAELQRLFADQADVAFVSFSVDPQTDTPERLGQFAERWHADPERWLFLTGEAAGLDRLIKERFLLPVTRDPMEAGKLLSQNLVHTNRFAIVDRSGTVRAYVDGLQPESVSVISRIVLDLLAEPASDPSLSNPNPKPQSP